MRGHLGCAFALLVAVLVAAPSKAATVSPPTYQANDYGGGQVMSILPPGENGRVNAADAALYEANGTRPPGSQDQLGQYANLLYAQNLSNADLGGYYNDESFGIQPQNVTATEQPDPTVPVVIYRDQHRVPHVYGQTLPAMAYGAGYAGAEDRLVLMDVLRHYGSGTLASFLGPTCAFEQMDHDQLLLTGYSQQEKQTQIDNLQTPFAAIGIDFRSELQGFVDGINAYVNAARTNPQLLPADYSAAAAPPQTWTPSDVIDIAGLVGGIFGKGGGIEVRNAALLQYLQRAVGAGAPQVFSDFKSQNDPEAQTTLPQPFPYEIPGAIKPALTAMPDDAAAPLSGGPTATTPGCSGSPPSPAVAGILGGLLTLPKAMSNALLVDGAHSSSGHPLAVFGPQVAYFSPQILMEEDLHGPDYAAEGAAFPGTNLVVQLGRGQDYAWSATSAGSDIVDQRLELICNPSGGAPAAQGTYYMFKGKCLPMEHKQFTEIAPTKPGCQRPCPPAVITHDIYDTVDGVVQGWTTSGGLPAAVTNQRSTYMHELDSGVGFARFGKPSLTRDARSWMTGAGSVQYTFNWFYADNRDIAYYQSGLDPLRPGGVDPNLPTWGTGGAEWQGFLGFNGHPHAIGSPTGFFDNWNNKPAPQFSAADDQYAYGPTYRSQSLTEEIQHQLDSHAGKISRADLVTAMETAATRDLSGRQVLPYLLTELAQRPEPSGVQAMVQELGAWLNAGAQRKKANPGDSQYAAAAAVAIMDELYPRLQQALFGSLLGDVDKQDGLAYDFKVLPLVFADTPHGLAGTQHGSAYDGGFEGYDTKVLRQVMGQSVPQPFSPATSGRLCGGGLSGCGAAIDQALADTYSAMVSANGNRSVSTWTQDSNTRAAGEDLPAYDAIIFAAVGLVTQPHIDWQNRPTFQQVVEFPSHRPR